MTLLLLKLLATPFLITFATLAGRRWGPAVNGMIVGLPLITGPVSFVLAFQYGPEFAARVAAGNIAGQVSLCGFCVLYYLVSKKSSWILSALIAVASWFLMTFLLNRFVWNPLPAFGALMAAIAASLLIILSRPAPPVSVKPARWDLPARIGVGTTLVFLLTKYAGVFGPQLSGLLATFPVYALIFTTFAHFSQGAEAAATLVRGIVLGLISNAFFFLVLGFSLVPLGIAPAYILALGAALLISGLCYRISQTRIEAGGIPARRG